MHSRDADLLIIPGLGGSGPDHWQSRWQAKLPTARRVEQDDWDRPVRDAWVERIADAVARSTRPVVVLAHSLGVIAFAHATAQGGAPVAGAFLVAPPAAEALAHLEAVDPAFVPYPDGPLPSPSLLVGSRTDPFATTDETAAMAKAWGATLLDAGAAGHINADSGHGPWPEGLMSFAGFLKTL